MAKAIPAIFIILLIVCYSCEKNISFKPNNAEPALVVEAYIENGRPPEVRLSSSLNFFSTLTPALLEASFIHNASITISNGVKTHKLREYERRNPYGYSLYVYSIDSSNLTTAFRGEPGKSYSITIRYGGKEYTAHTTIPLLTKKIDSLSWKKMPGAADTNRVIIMATITDPPGYGNYIRYYIQLYSFPFYPALNSVFDDQITDGKTYTVQLEGGVNRANETGKDVVNLFLRGDSVTVKFCNIDKATYDFWRTMEYNYNSIGNPFSSPTKVLGNISNGALGYFGGYAAQYKSMKIPR